MNIYRNQSSPFFFCSPLYAFPAAEPIPQEPAELYDDSFYDDPSLSSFLQVTVSPKDYAMDDFLLWDTSLKQGNDISLTPEKDAFAFLPDRLFYVSYFLRGYLPAHTWLEIHPYLDLQNQPSYIRSAHSCDLPCWANLSGGFLLSSSQTHQMTFQVKHCASSPISVYGCLHILPVSL